MELTERQSAVLSFIKDTVREIGFPPTRAEIAAHFGYKSANAADLHVRALQRKNMIRLHAGAARGISVIA